MGHRIRPLLVFLLLCALAACGTSAGTLVYRLEVRGKRSSLEMFAPTASSMQTDGKLQYDGGFYRLFTVSLNPDTYSEQVFAVSTAEGGKTVSTVQVKPFVCGARHAAYLDQVKRGAHAIERDQLFLQAGGQLETDTDLSYGILHHSCEVSSDSGASGDAVDVPYSSDQLCVAVERANTLVALTVLGSQLALPAITCSADYTVYAGDRLTLGFLFELPTGQSFHAQVEHCLGDGSETFPHTVLASESLSACNGWTGLQLGAERFVGTDQSDAVTGQWSIREGTWTKGGHVLGDLDLRFLDPKTREELALTGSFELPILRIPLE